MRNGWQDAKTLPIVRATVFTVGVALIFLFMSSRLLGGPPLTTDDPETPGRRGWEINISHNIERTKHEFLMESPLFDINYGRLENDQWKIEFPVLFIDPDDDEGHWGVGDLLVGWKYRFIEEDKRGYQASVYPQVLAPTGNEGVGLSSGHTELLLPVQAGEHLCNEKVFVYGEVGYNIVFGEPESNFWKYGLAAEWQASEKLELMGEVGWLAFPRDVDPDDVFFNFGVKYDLSDRVAFIGSAGRSFRDRNHGTPDLLTFLGVQITLGGEESPPRQ